MKSTKIMYLTRSSIDKEFKNKGARIPGYYMVENWTQSDGGDRCTVQLITPAVGEQ